MEKNYSMSEKNRILFITMHNPFGFDGGSVATNSFLKLLSFSENTSVDLCMANEWFVKDRENELNIKNLFLSKERNFLEKFIGYFQGILHRYYASAMMALENNEYDYVVLDKSLLAGGILKVIKKRNCKIITIHHNFELEYYKDDTKSALKFLLMKKNIKKSEKQAYKNSNLNIFLTEDDKNKFEKIYGNVKGKSVVSNIVIENIMEYPVIEKEYDFVISCSLSNPQNETTIKNFFINYGNCFVDKKVLVCGRNPSDELKHFLEEFSFVNLVPNPDFSQMNELLMNSKCYLCPIEIGGGIKVRCFDALKNLQPCLIHINSIRGYEKLVEQGFFIKYDDKESLVKGIELCIRKSNEGISFMKKYNEFLDETYSFSILQKQLFELL